MPSSTRSTCILFYIAALYDGVLGIGFVLYPTFLLESFHMTAPHPGYIQFSAALLIVFATMFLAVARKPRENRNLIPYGFMLKFSYCAVVFGYWLDGGLPFIWKPFAIADAVFAILFLWAYTRPAE